MDLIVIHLFVSSMTVIALYQIVLVHLYLCDLNRFIIINYNKVVTNNTKISYEENGLDRLWI